MPAEGKHCCTFRGTRKTPPVVPVSQCQPLPPHTLGLSLSGWFVHMHGQTSPPSTPSPPLPALITAPSPRWYPPPLSSGSDCPSPASVATVLKPSRAPLAPTAGSGLPALQSLRNTAQKTCSASSLCVTFWLPLVFLAVYTSTLVFTRRVLVFCFERDQDHNPGLLCG